MAIRQSFKVCDRSTLAHFIEWGKEISDAFAALGWVKASDSGQVDWATIASVPLAASPVYEVWKMNDSLQATSPFFLKIEYGIVSTSPQIWLTLGTGSNGSGTLNGAGSRIAATSTAMTESGNAQFECDFSGSTSRFNCCLWRNNTTVASVIMFGIERSRDNAGAETDEYATIWVFGNSALRNQQTIPKLGTGASPGLETIILGATFSTLATSSYGNKIAIAPVFPFMGAFCNPMTSIVGLKTGDWPIDGVIFNVTMYGASRTMLVIGKGLLSTSFIAGGLAAMRWD